MFLVGGLLRPSLPDKETTTIFYEVEFMKTCTKCRIEKDFSLFHKHKRYSDGHAVWCKACSKDHYNNVTMAGKPKRFVSMAAEGMKTCFKCRIDKPVSDFSISTVNKDGLRGSCKPCRVTDTSEYVEKNRDAVSENRGIYYRENKDRLSKESHIYYVKNKDAHYAKTRAWALANPERIKEMKLKSATKHRDKYRQKARSRYVRLNDIFKQKSAIYRAQNREKINLRCKESYYENVGLSREKHNLWARNARERLSDGYLRNAIIRKQGLDPDAIPASFIDLKRAQIQLLRELKQMEQSK